MVEWVVLMEVWASVLVEEEVVVVAILLSLTLFLLLVVVVSMVVMSVVVVSMVVMSVVVEMFLPEPILSSFSSTCFRPRKVLCGRVTAGANSPRAVFGLGKSISFCLLWE